MSFIDWAQANPNIPAQTADAGVKGALAGLDLGQKEATFNALRGINLNDPNTVNNAIGGLIHANALDSANALVSLNATRQFNSAILPQVIEKLRGDTPASPSSDAPQAVPAGAPAPAPPTPDAQHAALVNQAAADVEGLKGIPLDQRAAAAAALKTKYVNAGIPAGIVDQHLSDLSDAGIDQTAAYLKTVGTPTPAGQEPAAFPPHPAGTDAYSAVVQHALGALNDPLLNDPWVQAQAKRSGFDIEGYMTRQQAIAAPELAQEATERHAGAIASATAGAQVGPHLQTTLYDALIRASIDPQVAAKTAALAAAAVAPAHIETVKINGIDTQGTYVPKDPNDPTKGYEFQPIQVQASLAGQAPPPGSPAAPPGQSLAPGVAEAEAADRQNYTQAVAKATDPQGFATAQQHAAVAQQAAILAAQINPNAFTGQIGDIQNKLAGLGLPKIAGDPNQIATYNAYLQQISRGQFSNFPRIEGEFNLMQKAAAGVTTPVDAAKVLLGAASAMAQKDLAYRQFVADHKGDGTLSELNRAWLASPQGKSDIFGAPIFQHMTIDGQPALSDSGHAVKGKSGLWAVYRPNTPYATVVRVQ